MASVDDRIVRMEFDNAAFERKLSTTLASLGQLDKALKMTGATKGLTDVSAAAEKVHFGSISDGIENVSKKFIALSTIAITALSNITSKALMAGAQVAKAFTLSPIIEGFREYETQLNSVQTILANTASKGTTLDQVNDALQRLNTYSDQTIYNFGQMARNIGTFTAAGVDLETSVSSIKGIANLAAMSGSTSEQASTAMYQLSQAIAAGSLKLMDWNSVVNAGMGGEAFKSALFETQKVMGNVLNVPVGQTFTEWEDAGNSFRETLQDGWITADVLTTTLSAFTGDMTEEMLLQKGFSEQQAASILKTAAIAKAAATEVKTFTQLMGTVKEAVGTGWADSFKIIIGNFNEAKKLWTDVNNAIGGFVNKTSDARNKILQEWKDFGGRNDLIQGLKDAFGALGFVITAVKDAFSNIFPPLTSATLVRLTFAFKEFALSLTPSAETLDKIKRIASGVFAALSIGWEIIKEGTKFLLGLGKSLVSLISPGATSFLVKLGDGLTSLQAALVKGGGIKDFFATLTAALQKPLAFLGKIKDAIGSIFDLFDRSAADAVEDGMGRVGDRFESLKGIFAAAGRLWEPFENALRKIADVLDRVWDVISEFFSTLWDKIADSMGGGDFNNILDLINVGLLGGIALLIRRFFKEGFKFDLGGGLFEKISGMFEQLTGVFSAMQAKLKSEALMKIAIAIAVLTASVLVLSMIDSVALSKALTAMAVGFGELMGAFALLTKLAANPKAAAQLGVLALGLIALATAILILSVAVKILSTMKWKQLARGLTAVAALLVILGTAGKLLAKNDKGMIRAGLSMTAMAIALGILAVAMKIFATMSWEEMAKGLLGVATSLGVVTAFMHLLPNDMPKIAGQLLLIGASMLILAAAVAIFGNMEWDTIGKGFLGVGTGLGIIAGAMHLMPGDMNQKALGLIAVAGSLILIGVAMKIMATMSWEEIGKGLVTIGASLGLLAGGLHLMNGTTSGSTALIVASGALLILSGALTVLSFLKIEEIAKGLGTIAIVFGILAAAAWALSESIPIILALGASLALTGVGLAALGAGIYLIAKGLEAIAHLGVKAAENIYRVLATLNKAMPMLLKGVMQGLVNMLEVFVESAPVFAKAFSKLFDIFVEAVVTNTPKLLIAFETIFTALVELVRGKYPILLALGFEMLLQFLAGLKENITPITELVADIINKFLKAFEKEIPRTVENLKRILITMFEETARAAGEVVGTILFSIGGLFIQGFLDGAEDTVVGKAIAWFASLPGRFLSFIGDVANTLWQKGVDILTGLKNGIDSVWESIKSFFGSILEGIWEQIKNPIGMLVNVGEKVMHGLWNGMKSVWDDVKGWLGNLNPANWFNDINLPKGHAAKNMVPTGLAVMQGLHYGMQEAYGDLEVWASTLNPADALNKNMADNMTKVLSAVSSQMSSIEEFNPVITPVLDLTQVASEASKIGDHIRQSQSLIPSFSLNQARTIASQQNALRQDQTVTQEVIPQGLNFTQINNSPTQLSTSDIYKQTRNQIRIAKEELSIP